MCRNKATRSHPHLRTGRMISGLFAYSCSPKRKKLHFWGIDNEIANLQFSLRGRLQNCNFVDFLQGFHSRAYTLTEAETGQAKKHNDLKSSVPTVLMYLVRRNLLHFVSGVSVRAPKTTYPQIPSSSPLRNHVVGFRSGLCMGKVQVVFCFPKKRKGVKHHLCRLPKNQEPRHSPRGGRTLWADGKPARHGLLSLP